MTERPRPSQTIRRFDVFAEFTRLKQQKEGKPLDEAKGYGIWLAKVVAARRFRPASESKSTSDERPGVKDRGKRAPESTHERFRSLNDVPQTDEVF
ncbi:MAG TPA: hypothetical protein VKT80_05230, partial [Chloroflexota bacterium]|nr:hypothetical protein [Chloroflexota bacterium]